MVLDHPINTLARTPFENALRQLALANEPPVVAKRVRRDRTPNVALAAEPSAEPVTEPAVLPTAARPAPLLMAQRADRPQSQPWLAAPAPSHPAPLLPDDPAAATPRTATGAHKVLLVDDHDLVRMGIKALLDSQADVRIDWVEAATLTDALALYEAHSDVSLVLLDLNLADCKGLQGLRQMMSRHPLARVLILSGTQDEFVVRQAQAMGAAGYLNKAGSPAATRETLLAMLQPPEGDAPATSGFAPPSPATGGSSYDRVAELGPRHLEILELVLSGCTNQEISSSLGLSLGTVKNYVSTILLALDVKSRSHLISLFR